MDYSLLPQDQEVPYGQGLRLKRAVASTRSPGGVLTNNVQPGEAMGGYRERAADLYRQGSELLNQDPDYTQLQEFARQRSQDGQGAMLNALAAQFAGERFEPVQAQFLKRASAARDPMKVGGGMVTADGRFIKDPDVQRQRQAEFLMNQAKAYEQMAQSAENAQQRAAALAAQNEVNNQMRMLGLQIQQGNLDMRRSQQAQGQRLPFNAVQDLAKQAGGAQTMVNIANTFQDSFAAGASGLPGMGAAQNWLGRNLPGDGEMKAQANWWQNYNEQANRIRNELFGSALTLTEKAAFEAAMIGPDMDAKTIKARLKQQAAAAQRAYQRLIEAAQGSGYNVSGLPSVGAVDAPMPGQIDGGQGGGLSSDEQAELARLREKFGRK